MKLYTLKRWISYLVSGLPKIIPSFNDSLAGFIQLGMRSDSHEVMYSQERVQSKISKFKSHTQRGPEKTRSFQQMQHRTCLISSAMNCDNTFEMVSTGKAHEISRVFSGEWLCRHPLLQFSSVRSLSRVRLFATPWTAARQACLSITNSRSSPKLTCIESVMPSSHLILCCPLLLLPSISPSIRVFSNESTLHMKWPKH